jgi:hypothetical protein
MNSKYKLPVQVWASGGEEASVPRVPCLLNKPVMAGEINQIGKRLAELMHLLNVRECPSCRKLQQKCKNLAGICTECWTYCDDLADRFDFSDIRNNEIGRHWMMLSRVLTHHLASGRPADMWKRTGPPEFGMAAGIEATLGADRIIAAVLAVERDATGVFSWINMRWDAELGGLVPEIGKLPKQGEYQAWRNLWAARKGKYWVRIHKGMKEAA